MRLLARILVGWAVAAVGVALVILSAQAMKDGFVIGTLYGLIVPAIMIVDFLLFD